jgi:hypothetical protein
MIGNEAIFEAVDNEAQTLTAIEWKKDSVTRNCKDWRLRPRGSSCAQPIIEIRLCLGELRFR